MQESFQSLLFGIIVILTFYKKAPAQKNLQRDAR